jgi:hypothetical protein
VDVLFQLHESLPIVARSTLISRLFTMSLPRIMFRLLAIAALTIEISAAQQEQDYTILNGVSWWHPNRSSAASENNTHSCSSYNSCNACADASWCHWCIGDQACHAIGSIHGCVRGSDCQPPAPPRPASNDSCSAHASCADCTRLSNHLCHWCAHDNACHAVASVYGCVAGVDCYSNDRCQRREPEPIISLNATHTMMEQVVMSFSQIGFLPLMVVLGLAMSCVCCVSLCFCVSSGLKGAYDDLISVYDRDDENDFNGSQLLHHDLARRPIASTFPSNSLAAAAEHEENAVEESATEYVQLGQGSDHEDEEDGHGILTINHHFDADGNDNNDILTTPLLVQRTRRPVPRHMQRLFNYCRLCYVLTLLAVVGCSIASILYYPKLPSYNVCNDAVAWTSLINSLTNMKATADFEILVSVKNPNHFALALDHGMGSFTHNGAFVGTYDIPPTVAAPMSITDLLIVAHLAPDKWDALGLVAEYYRGKLVLYVDAEATLRIPMLANYTVTTALKNIVVNVNEQSERYLCACPNWNDGRLGLLGNELEAATTTKVDENIFLLPNEFTLVEEPSIV